MGVGDNKTDGGESSRDRSSAGSFFGEDMESKDSETLKEIYKNNDQTKWSPKTFEEIRNILEERGEEIPDQSPPKRPKGPGSDLGDSGSSRQSGNAFANFLGFKSFITTRFIKGIYLLGALAITIGGIVSMGRGAGLGGFFGLIIGNIVWRVICENLIVLFDIHDTLASIDDSLDRMS